MSRDDEPHADAGATRRPRARSRTCRRCRRPAAPGEESRDPLWYQRAVFYEVLIRGFADSNGDGTGDLRGLTSKLDYLQWLGIDCLWLLPIYESPLRDGGYDISDFLKVLPEFGDLGDFVELIDGAHRRGMRVIADLVMNHTSDQHPWFQASRSDPDGPFGDFYVWSDDDDPLPGRAHHLRRHREVELDVGCRARPVLLAPLLLPPARPELRQPGRPGRDAGSAALLARHRHRRLPAGRGALPVRARRHERREPSRRPTNT